MDTTGEASLASRQQLADAYLLSTDTIAFSGVTVKEEEEKLAAMQGDPIAIANRARELFLMAKEAKKRGGERGGE